MYCTYCNHQNNPENKYCESCGKPLHTTAVVGQPLNRIKGGGTKGKSNKNKIIVAAVLGFVILCLLVSFSSLYSILAKKTPSDNDAKEIIFYGLRSLGEDTSSMYINITRKTRCPELPSWVIGEGIESVYVIEYDVFESGQLSYSSTKSIAYKNGQWESFRRTCP